MSAVPPNLVGPILQSPLIQRQVSALRDAERTQGAHAQRQGAAAIDANDTTVETTDGDTQVHSESEGQGSQGRAFTSADDEQPVPADTPPSTTEEHGRLIDFEA